MKSEILIQLVHSGFLLDNQEAVILAGNVPPMAEIVMTLLFSSIDAAAVGLSRPDLATRCLLRQGLANSFLTALLFTDSTGAGTAVASAMVAMTAGSCMDEQFDHYSASNVGTNIEVPGNGPTTSHPPHRFATRTAVGRDGRIGLGSSPRIGDNPSAPVGRL